MNSKQNFRRFQWTRKLSFTEPDQKKQVLPVRQTNISRWDIKTPRYLVEVLKHGGKLVIAYCRISVGRREDERRGRTAFAGISFPSTSQREVFIRNHLIVQSFELIHSFLQNSGILMKKCYNKLR